MKLSRREFTFGLHTCRLGDAVRRGVNPSTGEVMEAPIDLGLTDAEREAVHSVLQMHGASAPDPDGFHSVSFPDGSKVYLGLGDLGGEQPVIGAEVNVVGKELTDDVLTFVLQVSRAGNMALLNLAKSEVVALSTFGHVDPKVRRRWPNATFLTTIAELGPWLKDKIGGRMVY